MMRLLRGLTYRGLFHKSHIFFRGQYVRTVLYPFSNIFDIMGIYD